MIYSIEIILGGYKICSIFDMIQMNYFIYFGF